MFDIKHKKVLSQVKKIEDTSSIKISHNLISYDHALLDFVKVKKNIYTQVN